MMIILEESALNIQSGAELLRFDLGEVVIRYTHYTVLTGWETEENRCWWCGKAIVQGKRTAHYCRGQSHHDVESCSQQYHRHFEWGPASSWALRRAEHRCENCGKTKETIPSRYSEYRTNLEVHHIVPLQGQARFFSAYNLPWNLIVLCHDCHQEIHRVMNYREKLPPPDSWQIAKERGQGVLELV